MAADGDVSGIDPGDLPELLDAIARDHEGTADLADEAATLKHEYDGFCDHRRATLNHAMRRLTCRACGAPLDPFDFLHRLTRESERWIGERRQAEQRAREAVARLDELRRQERNVKARLRNLQQKKRPDPA